MDLQVIKQTLSGGGFRHLKTDRGTRDMETITLDLSTFTKATHWPNYFLPAGIVLGKLAANTYGPYAGTANEVQHIAVDATAGTFTITVRGGTTAAIAWNATAAVVQTALELLAEVNVGDIVVTGGPGNAGATTPYVLTFSGNEYHGTNVAAVTTNAGSLTGGAATAAVTTTTAGGSSTSNGLQTAVGLLGDRMRIDPIFTPTLLVAALQWEGHIIEPNLPIAPAATGGGFIDESGKSDLGRNFRWVAA